MSVVCVIGLGYIGLPTALLFARAGHEVHGFDINRAVVDKLASGVVHIEEPGLQLLLSSALESSSFIPRHDIPRADAFIICVPTPFRSDKTPDLSFVTSAATAISPILQPGNLVVIESTIPVGTTRALVAPIVHAIQREALIVHCPETVLPGNMIEELVHNHRIIGGLTPEAADEAARLYETVIQGDIQQTDADTAEFVKLIENAYRDVNIAFANELGQIGRTLGVDVREAIRLANKHPRVRIHSPGPGVGGHCIPVDPWFLIRSVPEAPLLLQARATNDMMPAHVVDTIQGLIGTSTSRKVAILGLAYKGNVDDCRESPSVDILRKLKERGLEGVPFDPHVQEGLHGNSGLIEAASGAACLCLVTDHDEFRELDPGNLKDLVDQPLLFDTRGIIERRRWETAGFRVVSW